MMKTALMLVDCQLEFFNRRPLEPSPEKLVDHLNRLVEQWRCWKRPVVHVRLTVTRVPDVRLPHWKAQGRWPCVEGTESHAFPPELHPMPDEGVIDKAGFSGFENPALKNWLEARSITTVVLAGLYSHNCVRATALDAWRAGHRVLVVEDALGHLDLFEAEATRDQLISLGVRYVPLRSLASALHAATGDGHPTHLKAAPALPDIPRQDKNPYLCPSGGASSPHAEPPIVHQAPHDGRQSLWSFRPARAESVGLAVAAARGAQARVRGAALTERQGWLRRLATLISSPGTAASLARSIAIDVGKPIVEARHEVMRCVQLLDATMHQPAGSAVTKLPDGSSMRRVPLGTVAAMTPWNHPLAIAVGKIAPALQHGNTVVWKPAPAGSRVAVALIDLIRDSGWPRDSVSLVLGDEETARLIMASPAIDGLTLTGGPLAGSVAARWSMTRHRPLQAELGGNNAAIIWSDADEISAARAVARGAFGFAGQRCTANRRVIVPRDRLNQMLEALAESTRLLSWGDPLTETTVIGPVISGVSHLRITAAVNSAEARGLGVIRPLEGSINPSPHGWYSSPAIVVADDPTDDIVQRETFGPVLVVQPASHFDEAMTLVNGVNQGLVASLFTESEERWIQFRDRAQCGIVKWNQATAEAGVCAPFGGWKASGCGPPEHGPSQADFFTRWQAIYGT